MNWGEGGFNIIAYLDLRKITCSDFIEGDVDDTSIEERVDRTYSREGGARVYEGNMIRLIPLRFQSTQTTQVLHISF